MFEIIQEWPLASVNTGGRRVAPKAGIGEKIFNPRLVS